MKKATLLFLLIISLISTYSSSNSPDKEVLKTENYFLIKADFHVHSFFGDGGSSPLAVVYQAQRKGLNCFALTNHNQLLTAQVARWWTKVIDGPKVFIGSEITNPNYHIIGVNLNKKVDWQQSAEAIIKEVHAQGGIAITAHPTKLFSTQYDEKTLAILDGTEVLHSLFYDLPEIYPELPSFYKKSKRTNSAITPIASSDWHVFDGLGYYRTIILAADYTDESIMEALKNGNTVVKSPDGFYYGKEALIPIVQQQEKELFSIIQPNRFTQLLSFLFILGLVYLLMSGENKTPFSL